MLKKFLLLLLVMYAPYCMSQYSVSKAFYDKVEDTLKPANRENIKLMELLRMIDHNSLFYPEFDREKDSLIEIIKKNTAPLSTDDKIDAYFMLMLYNFNHNHTDTTQTLKYGDSVKMLVQEKEKGHFYQLFIRNAIEAVHDIGANRYGKAIERLNTIIEDADKVEYPEYLANVYSSLSFAYFQTFQFKEAIESYKKTDSVAQLYSTSMFKDHIRTYAKDKEVEAPILKYIDTRDSLVLKEAEETFQKHKNIYQSKTNDWDDMYYLRASYIAYLNKDFEKADSLFSKVNTEALIHNEYLISPYPINIIQALLQVHKGQLEEAYSFTKNEEINNPVENLYKELLIKALYKAYLKKGDIDKADFLHEQEHETAITQNIYKYQGMIANAEKKYNAHSKELKILELENHIQEDRNRNIILYATTTLLILLIIGIGVIRAKESRIKRLIDEEVYNKRIRLLEESLEDVDRKMKDNRKEIGEQIHNEYLGNLLALKYLVTDYRDKATIQKNIDKLNVIIDEVDALYQESRSFSHQLIHGKDENISLNIVEYLDSLQSRFEEVGLLKIHLLLNNEAKEKLTSILSSEQQQTVFHLLKETISNTIKHADAKNLSIAIRFTDTTCALVLENDGVKSIAKKSSKGVGLESLKQRFNKINGNIDFSLNASGFKTEASFPLQNETV
ncbi:sensor histidine kinase [Joostella sp. CR20]|uniref:sensor histidine kinase n=1 Tax=Joostella sp. CR20 TaxID=2804312 RepID=UPI00313F3DA0